LTRKAPEQVAEAINPPIGWNAPAPEPIKPRRGVFRYTEHTGTRHEIPCYLAGPFAIHRPFHKQGTRARDWSISHAASGARCTYRKLETIGEAAALCAAVLAIEGSAEVWAHETPEQVADAMNASAARTQILSLLRS
jgi:hypothetical protein